MRGSQNASAAALLKEQRRRDCARRHCRLYRGQVLQRQRFPGPRSPEAWPEGADKMLMRLNFPRCASIG